MTNGKTMQKLNEGYDSVNTVDGVYKSAILKGQTLVNHCPDSIYTEDGWITGMYKQFDNFPTLVKGKTYTFYAPIGSKAGNAGDSVVDLRITTDGTTKSIYTTWSNSHGTIFKTFAMGDRLWFNNFSITGTRFQQNYPQVMILDGDWSEAIKPPYFTGMQSVKMPVLTTTGKNLFVARGDEYVVNGISVKNENGNIVFGGSSNSYSSFDLITGEKFGGYNPNWKSYYQDKILHRVTGEFTFKASLGKPQGLDVGNGIIHQVYVVYDDDKTISIQYDSRAGNEVTKTVKFNVE